MQEKEEQRAGRNKPTQIKQSYIESGEYRRKFDGLTSNIALNKKLYMLAKRMLKHRSGTNYEDMYWIDGKTTKIVTRELNSMLEENIKYSKRTKRVIEKIPGLITIHSHPQSFPPSIEDLNSNYTNKYSIGVVIGHDGKVFVYQSNEYIDPEYFEMKVAELVGEGYNYYEARYYMLVYCTEHFDVSFKEV